MADHSVNLRAKIDSGDFRRQLKPLAQELKSFSKDLEINLQPIIKVLTGVTNAQEKQLARHAASFYIGQAGNLAQGRYADPARAANVEREFIETLRSAQRATYLGRVAPTSWFHPQSTLGGFARGVAGMGAIAGLGFFAGRKLIGGFEEELGRETNISNTMQRLAPPGMSTQGLIEMTRRAGSAARLTPTESAQFLGTMGAQAGARATPLLTQAMGLTRTFGLNPQQGAGIFGGAARMGIDTVEGQKTLAKLIAEAVQTGRLHGREGEVWDSVIKTTSALSQSLGLTGAGAAATAGTFATFERMAAVRDFETKATGGTPSLLGAGAAATYAQFQAGAAGSNLISTPNIADPLLLMTLSQDPKVMAGLRRGDPTAFLTRKAEFGLGAPGKGQVISGKGIQDFRDMIANADRFGMPGGREEVATLIGQKYGVAPRQAQEFVGTIMSNKTDKQINDELKRMQDQGLTAAQKAQQDLVNIEIALAGVGEKAVIALGSLHDAIMNFTKIHPDLTAGVEGVAGRTWSLFKDVGSAVFYPKTKAEKDKAWNDYINKVKRDAPSKDPLGIGWIFTPPGGSSGRGPMDPKSAADYDRDNPSWLLTPPGARPGRKPIKTSGDDRDFVGPGWTEDPEGIWPHGRGRGESRLPHLNMGGAPAGSSGPLDKPPIKLDVNVRLKADTAAMTHPVAHLLLGPGAFAFDKWLSG